MKLPMLLSLRIVVALLALNLSAGSAFADAEQEINQIEDARYDAMIAGDMAGLARILADEFTYHQPTGNVASKESYLQSLKSGEVKIKKAERHGVTVHVYGDVATAMGSTRVDLELKGEARQVDLRYINVWVKRDGRWQIVARQSAFKPK
jgi:ketosteroid isomerase-like protein